MLGAVPRQDLNKGHMTRRRWHFIFLSSSLLVFPVISDVVCAQPLSVGAYIRIDARSFVWAYVILGLRCLVVLCDGVSI